MNWIPKINWESGKETGGVIIGNWERKRGLNYYEFKKRRARGKFYFIKFLGLRNTAKDKAHSYRLPGRVWILAKSLKYILVGYEIIGIWHTHPGGKKFVSQQDQDAIDGYVKNSEKNKEIAKLITNDEEMINSFIGRNEKMVFGIVTETTMNMTYFVKKKNKKEKELEEDITEEL